MLSPLLSASKSPRPVSGCALLMLRISLINRMKSMKNFQLIVITHDECKLRFRDPELMFQLLIDVLVTAFLQRLAGNSNAFEYYW